MTSTFKLEKRERAKQRKKNYRMEKMLEVLNSLAWSHSDLFIGDLTYSLT